MKRREVPVRQTWDLSLIYSGEDEAWQDAETLKKLADRIEKDYKGKLRDAGSIVTGLQLYEQMCGLACRISAFFELDLSTDFSDSRKIANANKAGSMITEVFTKTSFVESEIALGDRIYHLILPVITLTIANISEVVLYTRQKVVEIIGSDFILYARARGENSRQVMFRHILRNVMLPAITLQFASFSELFGGMALAENVFAYPGIGTATTAAALNGDAPLLLGIALLSALFVFAGNLIANILYGICDPRIREGEK